MKAQVGNMHSLDCVSPFTEGDQVSQGGPAFHNPVLTKPDHLVVLYVPCDDTQDKLLDNLPWH